MYLMFPTIKPYIKGLFKLLNESGLTNKVAFNLLQKEGFKGINSDRANETLFEYLENKIQNEEVIPEDLQEFVKTINSILDQKLVSKLKYVNYDNSKSESEQTKGSLQNKLIELYKSVLLSEHAIGEVMTPVDHDHIKNDILHFTNKNPIRNLFTFNQLNDIDTKYDFLAGKAGVGQQANALMDYVLGSLGNLSITNFNVPKSNNRLDMEYSQELSDEDLAYYAKELKLSSTQAKKLQSVKIGHSLSAILNAFVDIAKDPYITRGNWVTMTTNTGNLLLRKGVHPFYVNAFLAQPIIKEYVEFSASYEASENQGLSTADAFIKERFGEDKYNKRNNSNIFNEDLKTLRSKEFLNKEASQMNVFVTFLKYQSASKAIKDNINASKHMVDGIGGSVNSLMIAKNAVDSILEAEDRYNQLEDEYKFEFKDNIILGFRSKFTNPNGSESMFSKYYNNVILEPVKIVRANPILFLESNQTIQNTFNEISHDLKNQILVDFEKGSKNLGKILNKTFYSYIMSGFNSLNMSNQKRKDLTLRFSKEFEQFQKDNKGKYAIIDQMKVTPGNTLDFIGLNNRKKSKGYEDSIVGSFLDLINTNEEFANKLIKYSYLTSGFNNHSSQFFTMIPTQWFNRNNINRYIIDTNDKYKIKNDVNDDFFIDQFYLANLENKKYVKSISEKQILKGSFSSQGFVLDKSGKAGYYRFKEDPNGINPNVYYKLIGYNVDNQGVYSRFISNINDELSEIKPLNVKDKKGNKIINYDTKGINLKSVTETSPSLAKNINKKTLSDLHDSAIYKRDRFYRENIIIKKDEIVETKPEVKPEVKGINIRSDKNNPNSLSNKLTNPNWYAKNLMDVEALYKANASKIKAPQLGKEDALKYDMNLMYGLQVEKFKKNPELIDEINENGGLDFIKQSSHIVGVKNSRWEGKGMESNFIKVLAKSYETVAKELNKFIESKIKISNKSEQLSLFEDYDRELLGNSDLRVPSYNSQKEYYLSKNTKELLNYIVTFTEDDDTKKIAETLLNVKGIDNISLNILKYNNSDNKIPTINNNRGILGTYNINKDTITLVGNLPKATFETVFIHELIHGITSLEYLTNKQFQQKIDILYSYASKFKKYRTSKGELLGEMYGMKDQEEFMAEAMSNPDFIYELSKYYSPIQENLKNKNIFEEFINLIVNLIKSKIEFNNKKYISDNLGTTLLNVISNYAITAEHLYNLSKNYAGTGSQEINKLGIQAIKDVYEKTKNSLSEIKTVSKSEQLFLFEDESWTEEEKATIEWQRKNCK